ncbi:hypothetical protein OsJ_17707 [Oryza sativa Japonica Group]|uniref:Reverse transcriptase zinc-binding domain-containing protein n=1 Tax=Oryza sativa subsp. japonica TaxID=39947 RepID=B9FNC9_ORYSJ|nr:hypothetical protein OsJ_17707 [Oryza sativa Japonica Group]
MAASSYDADGDGVLALWLLRDYDEEAWECVYRVAAGFLGDVARMMGFFVAHMSDDSGGGDALLRSSQGHRYGVYNLKRLKRGEVVAADREFGGDDDDGSLDSIRYNPTANYSKRRHNTEPGSRLGEWDKELIQDIFWEEDVRNILAIPLNMGSEDFAAWQVKHFLWRFAHNTLPLRMNIDRRGMEIDTRCPVCHRLNEDGGHCFFKCKYVKAGWRVMNLKHIRLELMQYSSALDVCKHILNMKEDKMLTTVLFLWNWWDARNKVNAGEDRRSAEQVYDRVMRMVSETSLLSPAKSRPNVQAQRKWHPPILGELKLNFDGAFFDEGKTGGWGFVVRDH